MAEGATCGSTAACAQGLVCVDGRCRAHVWGPSTPRPVAADGAASDVDEGPLDAADHDTAGVDADVSPDPSDALDGGDGAGDTFDTGDDGPSTLIIYLKEDSADVATAAVQVTLEVGKAWVTQLDVPNPGKLVAVEVLLATPTGETACGRLQPLVWDKGSILELSGTPLWTAPGGSEVTASGAPTDLTVDAPPNLQPGTYRVGVRYVEPCEGSTVAPAVASDVEPSGPGWVFTEGGDPTWVNASEYGVTGRFAIRARLEVAY